MNKNQLQKNVGKLFRIRPKVQRMTVVDKQLPFEDHKWMLEEDGKGELYLRNISTSHVFHLAGGNVREFRNI